MARPRKKKDEETQEQVEEIPAEEPEADATPAAAIECFFYERITRDSTPQERWSAMPVTRWMIVSFLAAAGIPSGRGGSRILLVFAEPRGWKGRAGLGEASLKALPDHHDADLIVLFAHPRIQSQLPPRVPVLLAWHRQRLMQDAVARWISRRVTPAAARPG